MAFQLPQPGASDSLIRQTGNAERYGLGGSALPSNSYISGNPSVTGTEVMQPMAPVPANQVRIQKKKDPAYMQGQVNAVHDTMRDMAGAGRQNLSLPRGQDVPMTPATNPSLLNPYHTAASDAQRAAGENAYKSANNPLNFTSAAAPQVNPATLPSKPMTMTFANPDAFRGQATAAANLPTPQQDYDRAHPGQQLPSAASSPENIAATRAYNRTPGAQVSPNEYANNQSKTDTSGQFDTPQNRELDRQYQNTQNRAATTKATADQSAADSARLNDQIAHQKPYSGSPYRGDGSQASTVTGLPTPDQAAKARLPRPQEPSAPSNQTLPSDGRRVDASGQPLPDNTPRTPAEIEGIRKQRFLADFNNSGGHKSDPAWQKANNNLEMAKEAQKQGMDPETFIKQQGMTQDQRDLAALTPQQRVGVGMAKTKEENVAAAAKGKNDAAGAANNQKLETAQRNADLAEKKLKANTDAGMATLADKKRHDDAQAALELAKEKAKGTGGGKSGAIKGENSFTKDFMTDHIADESMGKDRAKDNGFHPPQNFANASGKHWIQSPSGRLARNFFDDKQHFMDYKYVTDNTKDASGKDTGVWINIKTGASFDDDKADFDEKSKPAAAAPTEAAPTQPAATQPTATYQSPTQNPDGTVSFSEHPGERFQKGPGGFKKVN